LEVLDTGGLRYFMLVQMVLGLGCSNPIVHTLEAGVEQSSLTVTQASTATFHWIWHWCCARKIRSRQDLGIPREDYEEDERRSCSLGIAGRRRWACPIYPGELCAFRDRQFVLRLGVWHIG
jgi:hypothetical protein